MIKLKTNKTTKKTKTKTSPIIFSRDEREKKEKKIVH